MITAETPDSAALEKALTNAIQQFKILASEAMAKSLEAVEEAVSPYPPQPDRMRSGHLNTYVRGQGSYPRNAFIPDATEPGGFAMKKRVPRSSIRMTSQQMDKRYRKSVVLMDDIVAGSLWNSATYSGYVIGSKTNKPRQQSFHAETGWPNKEDSFEQALPQINGYIEKAIDKLLQLARRSG